MNGAWACVLGSRWPAMYVPLQGVYPYLRWSAFLVCRGRTPLRNWDWGPRIHPETSLFDRCLDHLRRWLRSLTTLGEL